MTEQKHDDACGASQLNERLGMTNKEWCKKQNNALFCCRATWGGWHIWEEGPAILVAYGKTPAAAWAACKKALSA